MIVSYLRSSSYSSYDLCEAQFFYKYVLGWNEPSGKKADLGNIVHKALELLARKKLASQNREATFVEGECAPGRKFDTASFLPEEAVQVAWDYYTSGPAKHHGMTKFDPTSPGKPAKLSKDFKFVVSSMDKVLHGLNGSFNPLNRDIVAPEVYFDYILDEKWAAYSYVDHNGKTVNGQLGVRGTVDLVTRVRKDPYVIEYVDWKTGARKCWAKNKVKTPEMLNDDFQLILYYYALNRLYPEAQSIIMTIHFINDGGPFTVTFEKRDLGRAMDMIRKRFEEIKSKRIPRQNIGFKCSKFCHFGMTLWKDQRFVDSSLVGHQDNRSICHVLHRQTVELGLDRVLKKFAKSDALTSYTGGGQQDVKSPNA